MKASWLTSFILARSASAQTGACYATSEHPSSYALNNCPTFSESACKADSGPHKNCVWCPYLDYHPQGGDCSAWCQGNDSRCRKVENTYEGCQRLSNSGVGCTWNGPKPGGSTVCGGTCTGNDSRCRGAGEQYCRQLMNWNSCWSWVSGRSRSLTPPPWPPWNTERQR